MNRREALSMMFSLPFAATLPKTQQITPIKCVGGLLSPNGTRLGPRVDVTAFGEAKDMFIYYGSGPR